MQRAGVGKDNEQQQVKVSELYRECHFEGNFNFIFIFFLLFCSSFCSSQITRGTVHIVPNFSFFTRSLLSLLILGATHGTFLRCHSRFQFVTRATHAAMGVGVVLKFPFFSGES
jgi:hypothetical protein